MMKKLDFWIRCWLYLSALVVLSLTFGIFIYIFYRGSHVLSPSFLLGSPKGMPLGTEGGIFPAIVGTLLLGLLSGLFGGILSLCCSLYISFYCTSSKLRELFMMSLEALSGVPSIVLGLFGYSVFIKQWGLPRSLLTASLTLSLMVLPFMTLRLLALFRDVSQALFKHSLYLGVTKSYTLLKLILPHTLGRICTTIGLGMSFAMGATAPIMFTGAVVSAGVPNSLTSSVMALPYHLYILANEGISMDMAYGTACVLMLILLGLHGLCHLTAYQKGKKHD
ncbi:MAG: ABC transporter permease subunit [Cellulosilyticaceae bacterium]